MISWQEIKEIAIQKSQISPKHIDKCYFEISEIEKQGAKQKWINWYITHQKYNKKFTSNPNNLLLPWLLGLYDTDPITTTNEPLLNTIKASEVQKYVQEYGHVPKYLIKDPDMPDIDIDCLPSARDRLKEYAIKQYGSDYGDGYGSVCSVGTWQTYKFKSAIIDVSVALGVMDRYAAEEYTTQLPDDVDELKEEGMSACKGQITNQAGETKECGFKHSMVVCPKCKSADTEEPTIGKLLSEHIQLQELYTKHKEVVDCAVKLVGRIRNMGMHAGALIITDRPLFGNIPLAKTGRKGFWASLWTEGRNAQLSKFGYTKWDFLGLKTLEYLDVCCKLIEENRGISFDNMRGWDDIDPKQQKLGYYLINNEKHYIDLNDKPTLKLINDIKVDSVFQLDTDLAKCCKYDSSINTSDGLKPICELNLSTDMIKYMTTDGISYTNNYDVVYSGRKLTYDIKLDNGNILSLTADHRVLTDNGYKYVRELKPDDEIIELH